MMQHAVFWLVVTCLSSIHGANNRDFEYYPGVGYYYMQDIRLNWFGAYATCPFEWSDLVVINSAAEAAVIKQILTTWRRNQAFVGVSDILGAGDYVSITGETLAQTGYKVWLGGAPSQDTKLRCVVYSVNGGLAKVDCAEAGYVICERPLWRADFKLVPGVGYYKLYEEALDWSSAWLACRSLGANLAVIDSDREYEALQDIISQHPALPGSSNSSLFHIGLQGQYGQAYFVTVYGIPVKSSGFNKWEPGHPKYNSAYAYLLRGGLLFSDSIKYLKAPYICEHGII